MDALKQECAIDGLVQNHVLSIVQLPKRIVGDFETMSVQVAEIAAVATPEDFLGRFYDLTALLADLREHLVYFLLRMRIETERNSAEAILRSCNADVLSQGFVWIQRKQHAAEGVDDQVIHAFGALLPTDPFIKSLGACDVCDADCDHVQFLTHCFSFFGQVRERIMESKILAKFTERHVFGGLNNFDTEFTRFHDPMGGILRMFGKSVKLDVQPREKSAFEILSDSRSLI